MSKPEEDNAAAKLAEQLFLDSLKKIERTTNKIKNLLKQEKLKARVA